MRLPILACMAMAFLAACGAKKPVVPEPGPETVRVSTSHPGGSFVELGPVTGIDGRGCGDDGTLGRRDGAVSSLMKNAFTMGGTHVQVLALYEPRQMGECFVNVYRISGTAYREAKAASSSPRTDVVQSLREAQKLRDDGVITPQEFERLKTKIIQ
jgi:Short C-terminal domain